MRVFITRGDRLSYNEDSMCQCLVLPFSGDHPAVGDVVVDINDYYQSSHYYEVLSEPKWDYDKQRYVLDLYEVPALDIDYTGD